MCVYTTAISCVFRVKMCVRRPNTAVEENANDLCAGKLNFKKCNYYANGDATNEKYRFALIPWKNAGVIKDEKNLRATTDHVLKIDFSVSYLPSFRCRFIDKL